MHYSHLLTVLGSEPLIAVMRARGRGNSANPRQHGPDAVVGMVLQRRVASGMPCGPPGSSGGDDVVKKWDWFETGLTKCRESSSPW